eukprot:15470742-Alexandrium_andersonii.AAC.1
MQSPKFTPAKSVVPASGEAEAAQPAPKSKKRKAAPKAPAAASGSGEHASVTFMDDVLNAIGYTLQGLHSS